MARLQSGATGQTGVGLGERGNALERSADALHLKPHSDRRRLEFIENYGQASSKPALARACLPTEGNLERRGRTHSVVAIPFLEGYFAALEVVTKEHPERRD